MGTKFPDTVMLTFLLLLTVSITYSHGACPNITHIGTSAWSAGTGCLFADTNEVHRYDTYDKAVGLCREVFGPTGRLAEILSKEEQDLATTVMRAGEEMLSDPKLSYWWSGLKDSNDDRTWEWENSGTAVYTNWHKDALPEVHAYDCMQFLSGTYYQGQWMNFQCYDNFISTRPLCQLK